MAKIGPSAVGKGAGKRDEAPAKMPAAVKTAVLKAKTGAASAAPATRSAIVRMSRVARLIHKRASETGTGAPIRVGAASLRLFADYLRYHARRIAATAAAGSLPRKGSGGDPAFMQITGQAVRLVTEGAVRAF